MKKSKVLQSKGKSNTLCVMEEYYYHPKIGAFRRYFLSTFETEKKKQTGMYNEHKRKCRAQGRKKEVRSLKSELERTKFIFQVKKVEN